MLYIKKESERKKTISLRVYHKEKKKINCLCNIGIQMLALGLTDPFYSYLYIFI